VPDRGCARIGSVPGAPQTAVAGVARGIKILRLRAPLSDCSGRDPIAPCCGGAIAGEAGRTLFSNCWDA
jgi:hypothetical protein